MQNTKLYHITGVTNRYLQFLEVRYKRITLLDIRENDDRKNERTSRMMRNLSANVCKSKIISFSNANESKRTIRLLRVRGKGGNSS
jgi:hypothetical protein